METIKNMVKQMETLIKLVIKLCDEQNPPSSDQKKQIILEINNPEILQL